MRDIAREELIAELQRLRPELQKEGVTHMALFGSRARRDNRPDSDVDLVVDLDESRRLSLLDIVGFHHIVEDGIGLPAHITTRGSLAGKFKQRVERDQVPVF
jgi:predicted nucleotidyltransferase